MKFVAAALLATSAIASYLPAVADPLACIEEKCPTQWAACLDDPKCKPALDTCLDKCNTDITCWTFCVAGKSATVRNVAECGKANNCLSGVTTSVPAVPASKALVRVSDPLACIEEKCPTQWAACLDDPKCKPALDTCLDKCNTDITCWTFCVAGKSATVRNVAECGKANNCLSGVATPASTALVHVGDPLTCIEQQCPDEWAKCAADPKCKPALDYCLDKCKSDVPCWTFCLAGKDNANATTTAKCGQAHDCLSKVTKPSTALAVIGDPYACIQENCKADWGRCTQDPKCKPALDDCLAKCDKDTKCWTFCITGKGNANAIAVAKCGEAFDCLSKVTETTPVPSTALVPNQDPITCITEHCQKEWNNCSFDPKCPGLFGDCLEKCTTASCWKLCVSGTGDANVVYVTRCGQNNGCLPSKISVSDAAAFL